MRDIRNMMETLNAPNFGGVYRDEKGEDRPCFNLPKRETLILVSGYSVELRARQRASDAAERETVSGLTLTKWLGARIIAACQMANRTSWLSTRLWRIP